MPDRKIRLLAPALAVALIMCLALYPAEPFAQEKKKLTIDDVLNPRKFSKPRPSGFMWLPDGESFLFFLREGKQNILWLLDCESGERTKIADWSDVQKKLREQQGEREEAVMGDVNATGRFRRAGLTMSHDGKVLMGAIRNDLFLFDISTGEARFITNDAGPEIFPTFSPDDKKVAFARDADIYTLDIASGDVKRHTERQGGHILNGVSDWVYEEELAVRRSFWWAPDSKRIAFLRFDTSPIKTFPISEDLASPVSGLEEQQYPKAGDPNSIVRLGIINTSDGKTTWINTGGENDFYIPRVGWLPGGSALWYMWLNRDQTNLELRFADTGSGSYRTVLSDKDDAWVGMRITKLTWVDDKRFIWAAEWDGWQHLYLYNTDGKQLGRITSGEWEVKRISGFDPGKKSLIIQTTKDSPLERHIYSANIDGSGMKKLTEVEGSHSASMPDAGRYFIHTWSNPSTPTRMELCGIDGKVLHLLDDGKIPALEEYDPATPEYFTVTAEDGATLHAMMIKPNDFDPSKKYPVLVQIYGGPESQMVRKAWSGRGLFNQLLVQEGIIIFSIDNRGTASRGRDWCRIVHRNLGYWEVKDHVEGVKYLKTLPYIDGERIGIRGGSYGGYMTLMALVKAPEHFQVGVSGAPVTDWRLYDTIYTERYMDTPQDNPEGYRKSAPINFAKNFKGKLLLTHGTMDNNVHLQNSIQMIEALIKDGKNFELMLYPRERHGIRSPHRQRHYTRLVYDFLMRELKNSK